MQKVLVLQTCMHALLQPIHMGSQVPLILVIPNMEAKSHLLSLTKPLKSDRVHFMQKYSLDLWV